MHGFSGVVVQKLKRFPLTVFQFMASFIENLYCKKTGGVQVRKLFIMRSKIVNFICSCSNKHRLFSEVRNDMEADVMKLCIMLRHDVYPEEKF